MADFSNKQILVTGATGFIGRRLVQRLLDSTDARVTGTGRNVDAVKQLIQAGADIQRAHLLDFATMGRLLAGKDIVYHVAAWLGPRHGPADDAWAINAYATEQLVRIAADSGVSRVVLISSIAAYGPPDAPVIDETHPVSTQQRSAYGRTKAEGELLAQRAAGQDGIQLVIARPGIVYGPGSMTWSRRILRLVCRGVPVVFGDGSGYAHPVFIDNLVDGLLLAATHPAAPSHAFNFVDQPLPWREWFGYFGTMCGRKPRRLPMALARGALRVAEFLPLGLSVDRDLLAHYTNKSRYSTDLTQTLLGYTPRISIGEGMALTEAWFRQEGLL